MGHQAIHPPHAPHPPRPPQPARRSIRARLWALGAKLAGLALAGGVFWTLISLMLPTRPPWGVSRLEAVLSALLFLIICAVLAPFMWIAWRLWANWSAGTVRLVVGVMLALGTLMIWGATGERWMAASDLEMHPTFAIRWSAGLLAVVAGALIYRKLTRAIIRSADLPDPRDAFGQPAGHVERARFFCTLLAWSVGVTTWSIILALAPDDGRNILAGSAAAIVLGIVTYRLALWRFTPRTTEPLPPGGFEVLQTNHPPRDEQRGAPDAP